jgi:hypothetical protein
MDDLFLIPARGQISDSVLIAYMLNKKEPGAKPGSFIRDVLLLFHWQIVNIQVAVKTSWEQLKLGFRMRSCMALGALGNGPVASMAHGTIHFSVFTWSALPLPEDLVVAPAASLGIIFLPEADLQRFVNGVTGHATSECLSLEMGFMAL